VKSSWGEPSQTDLNQDELVGNAVVKFTNAQCWWKGRTFYWPTKLQKLYCIEVDASCLSLQNHVGRSSADAARSSVNWHMVWFPIPLKPREVVASLSFTPPFFYCALSFIKIIRAWKLTSGSLPLNPASVNHYSGSATLLCPIFVWFSWMHFTIYPE
jgi:hypothetical protein